MARRRGKGGFNGAISSFVVLVLLAAGILSWVKINNIDSLESFYWYLRGWSDKTNECAKDGLEGLKNCDYISKGSSGKKTSISSESSSKKGKATKKGTDNLKIKDTLKASKEVNVEEVSEMLDELTLAEPQTDIEYVRSDWKHWTGSPCNTRQDVLIDQGEDVKVGDKCKILSGTWIDPFSTEVFTNSSDLDIDHVIPLGYAAKMGANDWDKELKEQFANDRMHLLAVSAKENRSKGDKGPGYYMPPNKDFHCDYAVIWTTTLFKYDIAVTGKDRSALEKALKTC